MVDTLRISCTDVSSINRGKGANHSVTALFIILDLLYCVAIVIDLNIITLFLFNEA